MSTNDRILNLPVRTVGIVGGGVAGLVTAKQLGQAGFECTVFERGDRVGGVWTVGYHGFGLQTPRSFYEFPDWPMPDSYPDLPTGAQMQAYVDGYARHFGLTERIRFGRRVSAIEPAAEGTGWHIAHTDANGNRGERDRFDYVVIANGLYATPYVPELPDRDRFGGEVMHSSEYHDPAHIRGRKVVVVGFGKSALDIAVDAKNHGADVTLVFRDAHWPVPVKVLGLIDVRKIFMTRAAGAFLPLYQRPGPWEARLHQRAPWLVSGFWRGVEGLLRLQYRIGRAGALPSTRFENDLFTGGILPTDDTYPLLRSGQVQPRRGQIERFTDTGVQLDDGDRIDTDVVVFATGWQRDDSLLPAPVRAQLDDDGLYLYRHILPVGVPNLAFIGWASTYSNSLTSHLTGLWLTHLLTGRIAAPEAEAMAREVADMKRWKRGFMPSLSCRGSMLQLHMWHFHDELLTDMGLPARRKSNPVAELFGDYGPADYAGLFTAAAPAP
ncbi:flavin-containing monooxygenase [Haliangium sp.]|uniref:flavin-containing monooxygenase n=1 Tax=Haliangium sp. TaxID=2663208 RepID=UPI003D0AFA85